MKKMGLNQQLVNNEGYLDGCQNGFRVVTCFFWWRFMGDVCGNLWNIDEDIEMIYHEIA